MSISKEKVRVALTLPADAAEAFRLDARSLNMTLSNYVWLLLAANSSHLDEFDNLRTIEQLELLRDGVSPTKAKSLSREFAKARIGGRLKKA